MNSSRSAPGIQAGQEIRFTFDGKRYAGLAGDTLASALLANGVFVVGRSLKLHRPRGVLAAGADEPNAIVQLEPDSAYSEPDLKATQVALYEGLSAKSVNRWPSLAFDALAVLGLFKRFLPAGFYYKTFIWPSWHVFEPAIRRAAGLGLAPGEADPDKYDTRHLHCDVLVVGAGPAGLAASMALAGTGAAVTLVDEQPAMGASFMRYGNDAQALRWAKRQEAALMSHGNVRVLRRTTAQGIYDGNLVSLIEKVSEHQPLHERGSNPRQRLWLVRARHVILATGAHERPIVFPNNDRPGIMLAGAAATYAAFYGVVPGRRALGFTNNDLAYGEFFAAHDSGLSIEGILDVRPRIDEELAKSCLDRGIPLHAGTVVCDTRGRRRIKAIQVRDSNGTRNLPCDLLLMSGGWSPAVHLYSQALEPLRYDETQAMFRPEDGLAGERCLAIGSANGAMDIQAALGEAHIAAARVARALGRTPPDAVKAWSPVPSAKSRMQALWRVEGKAPAWVDFQSDVTESDIQLAARENFASVEHLKRYTTLGMASDQGKTSSVNALALLGMETNRSPAQVGTTRFRPPYTPVTIGAMAGSARGNLLHPRRLLAAHGFHLRHDAHMLEYGQWMRPACYRRAGETDSDAWNREVLQVRESVGVFDGSPLGKIEVKGPDAAALLNAVYANELANLAPRKCRYAVVLNENGGILDDGVISRLADDHFLVGTSSAGATRVAEYLEYWRESGTGFRAAILPVTDQWATYAVTGPQARDVLRRLPLDFDLEKDAFPHMSFRQGHLGELPCRVARVSFSGEVTYEISVPAHYGDSVLTRIVQAGARPFGIEALMIMRVEKGYIHVGADTEPLTTLADVGMGAFGAKKEKPFVGQRAALRPAMTKADRLQLVGIEAIDPGDPLRAGAHLVDGRGGRSHGHLTSCVWSPTLKKYIALALLQAGASRRSQEIKAYDDGKYTPVRVVGTCFLDESNEQLQL